MTPIIFFDRVKKSYPVGLGARRSTALADLTFSVEKGEVFGIVGPNGAGKSTTLKILLGFVRPDAGRVTLLDNGPDLPAAHRCLGYLPENSCLYDHLTARDHLRFALRTAPALSSSERARRIDDVLTGVKLTAAADLPVRRYSKGMVQRAALAFALVHEPEILILDEPMSGLDPLGRQLVIDVIKACHQKGSTILFCSHILTDVERICDRIGIMSRGRLLTVITPEELKGKTTGRELAGKSPLEHFFLETIEADDHEKHLGGRPAEL